MPGHGPTGFAFNRTRTTYLATELVIARTHWSRFRGLMATDPARFRRGQGLWITPSRGVHTFAMRFPIDVVYLDQKRLVIHIEEGLKPWRMAAIRIRAASVLELPIGTVHDSRTALGDQVDILMERPLHREAA
ncbi:MAG TPA: DUF192 domain-containing protein [Terriglobales bacterium]|nr:DUF192 domain-containing protein [Terriglobales bacterium]